MFYPPYDFFLVLEFDSGSEAVGLLASELIVGWILLGSDNWL